MAEEAAEAAVGAAPLLRDEMELGRTSERRDESDEKPDERDEKLDETDEKLDETDEKPDEMDEKLYEGDERRCGKQDEIRSENMSE